MTYARARHTATLLSDGRLLVTGGTGIGNVLLASAEVLDPLLGTWTATGSMNVARSEHTATLLPSGRVLVVGGAASDTAAEVWDPTTGAWSPISGMPAVPLGHTATLLRDGSVLVAAGGTSSRVLPGAAAVASSVPMARVRYRHSAALLPDGRVLVIGGHDASQVGVDVAEIYDPATGSWSATAPIGLPVGWDGSATTLRDGRVLVHGGRISSALVTKTLLGVETFSAATESSSDPVFFQQSATLFPSGQVLFCGGSSRIDTSAPLKTCNVYVPGGASGTWLAGLHAMSLPRIGHTGTLLKDGRVLLLGGFSLPPATGIPSPGGEYFVPSSTSEAVLGPTPSGSCGSLQGRKMVLLPDGRVLVAGRLGPMESSFVWSGPDLSSCQQVIGDIASIPSALTLLHDGRALASGGVDTFGSTTGLLSVFNPVGNAWSPFQEAGEPRKDHEAVLLEDGRVLLIGGWDQDGQLRLTTEIVSPDGTLAPGGTLMVGRAGHRAIRLRDGRVLVVGGRYGTVTLQQAEIFDPAEGPTYWRATGATLTARVSPTLSLLPDGRVLVAGGLSPTATALATTEIFDPVTERWTAGPDLLTWRVGHSATVGTDGRITFVGGFVDDGTQIAAESLDPVSGESEGLYLGLARVPTGPQSVVLPNGFGLHCPSDGTEACILIRRGSFLEASRPVLTAVPGEIRHGTTFSLTGAGLGGPSEGSSGTRNASAVDHPLFELRSLSNGDLVPLRPDGLEAGSFRDDPLTLSFGDLPSRASRGWYFLTAFTLGVPSESRVVRLDCGLRITSQPSSVVVFPGERATFSVAAQGGVAFRWQRDVTGPAEDDFEDIPGATSPEYFTDPVVGPDSGIRYRAVVDGRCSGLSATSEAALLTVQDLSRPVVTVETPTGGEFWPLSTADVPQKRIVAWSMADDVRICQVAVRMLHSDDGGSSWSEAEPGGGIPMEFGSGGLCVSPVTTTSLLYSIPTTFPSGRSGSLYKIRVLVTDQAGNVTVAESPNPFYIVNPNPDTVRTLILHDVTRQSQLQGLSPEDATALVGKLQELAGHPRVQGLVVGLSGVTTLGPLYAAWDGATDPSPEGLAANANAANALLFGEGGIHPYLRSVLSAYTGVKYLVLVGDDRVIPFARIPDGTSLFPESSYPAQSGPGLGTPVGKALAVGQYLSDDPLAVLDPVAPSDVVSATFLPDLAVGRLVETPAEITKTIATFIGQDGVLDLTQRDAATGHKVLVTGYDFLTNVAVQIEKGWQQALGLSPSHDGTAPLNAKLVGGLWEQPDVPLRRTALRDALAGTLAGDPTIGPYGILALSGHATHFEEGVPGTGAQDIQGLPTSGIYGEDPSNACTAGNPPPIDLSGSVIYAVGCHGGLSVPGSCQTGEDASLDLPQTFLSRGAVAYVSNTGYGWGLRFGIGYGARLAQIFTEQLTSATGTQAVGDVLKATKARYYLEVPRFDAYDQKSLMQWTLYGLPMYAVKTRAQVVQPKPSDSNGLETLGAVRVTRRVLSGDTDAGGNATSGAGLSATSVSALGLPSGLTQLSLTFDLSAEGVYDKHDSTGALLPPGPGCIDSNGCYYTLNGLVDRGTGSGDLPIQPYLIYDSRLSGTSQHGVLWLGGTYDEESPFKPVIGELISNGGNGSDHGSTPRASIVRPTSPRIVFGQDPPSCRPSDLEMNSLTIPAGEALKAEADDEHFSIARRYRLIDLEVLYFNDRTPGSTKNCDRTGPTLGGGPLDGAYHQLTSSTLRWQVPASDASGVWRIVAVYNPNTVTAGQGTWTPVELLKDPTGVTCPLDSFCGQTTVAGTTRLTYVLQAVDARGNVTWLDYVPVQLPASGVNPGLPLPVDVAIVPPCTPPAAPVVTAPAYANAGQTGLPASVPNHGGSTYAWTISANGSITSGNGTSSILFSALAPGPLTLSVTESTTPGCTSSAGTATVTVLPAGTTPPTSFVPLTPCRLVDTRDPVTPDGLHQPILATSPATRTFVIPAGLCGIPADARALSVNYTVVENTAAGDLKAWAADETTTPDATVLSFPASRTRANNGFLKLPFDASRAFTVELLSPQPAHFVLDVNGVFR